MDRDSWLLVTRPLCVPSSAGASLLNSQCTVTGLVPNEARKRKTFLCSNPNDRVRRSLLRGLRGVSWHSAWASLPRDCGGDPNATRRRVALPRIANLETA